MLEPVGESLATEVVVGFLTKFVPWFYASISPPKYKKKARKLPLEAFQILKKSQLSQGSSGLLAAGEKAYREVFKKDQPEFWFSQIRAQYDQVDKPKKIVGFLKPFLKGKKVLDIGCGRGYLSLQLAKEGYKTSMTDILDYRDEEVKKAKLRFKKMVTPVQTSFQEGEFDTAFFFEVLHHVDQKDQPFLLKEAGRMARRIIVVEEIYGELSHPFLEIATAFEDKKPTDAYLSLSWENQLKTLILMDFYANVVSKGIREINLPFQFRTVSAWLKIFKRANLSPVKMVRVGFLKNTLHRNLQVYFVLERS